MEKDYPVDLQKLFLEIMLSDAQSFVRVQNIFNHENFDRSVREAAKFIADHTRKYTVVPTYEQIRAVTATELNRVELDESQLNWFLEEFENFTRRQELERAILKSADLIAKGDYNPVEKLIKDAVQISLTKDMGTDYFADPKQRLILLKSNNGQVSTGWPNLDKILYGGFNRGELQIFAGGSGSGKSLVMQNLSVNWVLAGLNGVYLTLELSEGLCSMRIDSMVTDTSSKEIFKDIDNVDMKLRIVGKKSGRLQVKYMPAQSNVNDIRSYVKELQIQSGNKIDFLCVDYLDLIMPVSAKVSPNDLFVKDKYVSEELRNLAKELNVLFVTASQLNRSAVEEVEFDHSHIAGGISKINTADNVFGIFTSRAMRERGKYQIQAMKTRSSSGVGQKVELEFDIETLRIRDLADDGEYNKFKKQSSTIYDQIKSKSTITTNDNVPQDQPGQITVTPTTSKLKEMLAGLKSNRTV
jgi:KaiC/GvpD/RAD55 family RecA-like ATPase